MPPPARSESIRAEARRRGVSVYRVRVDRGHREHIASRVAVGHGVVPKRIAAALERQRRGGKGPRVKTQERYRGQIAQYERKYWGSLETAGELKRKMRSGTVMPVAFPSEEVAHEYAEELGIPDEYYEVRGSAERFMIWRLR